MKKKACKRCKLFIEGDRCPGCKSEPAQTTLNWQGRLFILDHKNSIVASKLSIDFDGEYAIKVR